MGCVVENTIFGQRFGLTFWKCIKSYHYLGIKVRKKFINKLDYSLRVQLHPISF